MSDRKAKLERPEALHRQIANVLQNQIESGVLKDGHVLSSNRALAEEWDVSVFTISEAIKVLASKGLVKTKSRSGTIVVGPEIEVDQVELSQPHVVFVAGYAGSGKSEFSRVLAKKAGWAIIDKDTVSRPLTEESLVALGSSAHDRESDIYLERVRPKEYKALADAVNENVECGNSVIATAPYLAEVVNQGWVEKRTSTLTDLGAVAITVWVECDAQTMYDHIRHRGAARDVSKLENWDEYLAGIDFDMRPVGNFHTIKNSAVSPSLQTQAEKLIETLRQS